MTRVRLTLLSLALLALTTPVWFRGTNLVFGFPSWSLAVFAGAILYACGIAWLLGRYWSLAAGDDASGESA